MISCLICLSSLETSTTPSVCIPTCGHVYHHSCILKWCEINHSKTCPKCRCPMPDTNQLIKLFFGTSEVSNAATELLKQNQICRKKIDFLLQEVNKNLQKMDDNLKELSSLMSSEEKHVEDENENESGTFKLKSLAVLLSRSDEHKRIQEYYNSINNTVTL